MRLGKSGAPGVKKAMGVEGFVGKRLHDINAKMSIVKSNHNLVFIILHSKPDALNL